MKSGNLPEFGRRGCGTKHGVLNTKLPMCRCSSSELSGVLTKMGVKALIKGASKYPEKNQGNCDVTEMEISVTETFS